MNNISKEEADDLLESLQYFEFAGALEVKRGETIAFPCNGCHSVAYASRSVSNGHLHIWCDKCGSLISV